MIKREAKENRRGIWSTGKATLSETEVIQIAKDEIRGYVSYPPDTPIEVVLKGTVYVVTFKTQLSPGSLGADYHARVLIDADSGEVTEVLVGS